jgi:hypothetical protein
LEKMNQSNSSCLELFLTMFSKEKRVGEEIGCLPQHQISWETPIIADMTPVYWFYCTCEGICLSRKESGCGHKSASRSRNLSGRLFLSAALTCLSISEVHAEGRLYLWHRSYTVEVNEEELWLTENCPSPMTFDHYVCFVWGEEDKTVSELFKKIPFHRRTCHGGPSNVERNVKLPWRKGCVLRKYWTAKLRLLNNHWYLNVWCVHQTFIKPKPRCIWFLAEGELDCVVSLRAFQSPALPGASILPRGCSYHG